MKSRSSILLIAITVLLTLSAGSVFADPLWEHKPDTAQYKEADWNNEVMRMGNLSPAEAKEIAESDPDIDFFFIVTGYSLSLGNKGFFRNGDTVFFSGEPWLGTAPGLADTYIKIGDDESSDEYYGGVIYLNDEEFYPEVSGELVFVDFYADWCGPCVAFGPVFEEVAGIHTDTMFIKVDVDVNNRVPNDFGVQYIPYIAAVYDGEEVGKFEGERTVSSFSDWCASYIEDYAGY